MRIRLYVAYYIYSPLKIKTMGFKKRGSFRKGRSRSKGRKGGRKTKRQSQYFVGRGGVRM